MASIENHESAGGPKRIRYLLAEFETPEELLSAAERVRDAGYTRWDAHSPFPVHGLDEAMGIKSTVLPWFVLMCGLLGAAGGLGLEWWTNAFDYPYLVSGKPLFSLPANIPVMFELTVLLSAAGALVGMLAFNGLPELYHTLFTSKRFHRATTDRFFISIDAGDPKFDAAGSEAFLRGLGGVEVESLED
ncbi:MAG: DUF3341 domain-containing protein [Acidobacteriota bacterium]